jgi:hypothetical protein
VLLNTNRRLWKSHAYWRSFRIVKPINRNHGDPDMKKSPLWSTVSVCVGVLITFFLPVTASQAKHNSDHTLTASDWQEVMNKVDLLEPSGLMPMLMPTIMHNQDALQLTDEQVNAFRAWRKKNYTHMVNVMNEVIEKMVQFRIESLSPEVSDEHLLASQSEIQELQRHLLKIKLSCRKLIMTTFTDEQWENFAFVVSDIPKLASLISQANTLNSHPKH